MSNVLKSKSILGVMIVATLAVAFAFAMTASAAYSHTGLLKMGMTSSQVMSLQQTLNGGGFLVSTTGAGSPGMESMYFGAKTKAAVLAFQAAKGLSVDGVVGAQTGAALAAMTGGSVSYPAGCTSTSGYSTVTGLPCTTTGSFPAGCTSSAGYSPTTGQSCSGGGSPSTSGPLAGSNGTIQLVTELTQYASEEVGDGQEDVKVLGFDLEVSNDGDIEVKSLKLSFDPTGNSGSDDLDDYLESVSVWMGDEEVGSANVDDFSQDSNDLWTRTISLSGAIVRAEDTEKFYVAVTSVNNLDSGDISGDSWTVDVESVRYEDGSGVVSTDTSGAIDGMDVPIAFVSFSAAADTELKISAHADNPEAGIVVVSDSGTTDDVVLLKGKLEAEGDSDIVLDEFPVTFGAVTSNFNTIVSSIRLVLDSEEFNESVPSIAAGATDSITFDNLDFTIDAGDTINFEVVAEIADADDFTAGSSVTASVTATNRFHIDAENEQGDNLAAGEKSGTAGGEAQEFRENGILVELVDTPTAVKSAVDADNGDTGLFTIKFKVTALGDNVYVASVASPDGAMANAYTLDYSGTATATDQSAAFVNTTDATLSGGVYLIEDGESETFEMTVVRNASATDGLYRVSLTNIKWDTDEDSTPDNTYTTELDEFKTPYIALD